MEWKVPLFNIYHDGEDVKAVQRVIERGTYWTLGPEVEEFEREVAKYMERRYAVAFANGTAALHAAMIAHGIGPGDEVIVPSFTFISTSNAPLFVGAKPVFADIETETLGLDPQDVRKKITPRTKAIIPVHVGGAPCLIEELREIADENDLILIEDAAEAFGAKVHGKMVGSYGDTSMFSFCQNKIITTGEGGMLVTDDDNVFQRLRLLRSHGRADDKDYFSSSKPFDYVALGYNLRMSSITA
ncbi:MAG: DegT/DnrJ/EryC1/StrS family aminotransferase, partial [Thermoplasmata archaeon]|nr:DegT/DnrJ/EryC1/StrS family aminotransferase [Thermoplasmata archaeon]